MFTADAFIDTVQTGKKTMVNTFVTNATVKDAMIQFIDAQAEYTKKSHQSWHRHFYCAHSRSSQSRTRSHEI